MAPLDFHTTGNFLEFQQMGFRELLPIIPPGAKSPLPAAVHGKAPAEKLGGQWWPMKGWRHATADTTTLLKWSLWGGNIGHRCGETIWAIDLDITDPGVAQAVRAFCVMEVGDTLERIGQEPKTALIVRCSEAIASCSILFKVGGVVHRIDILGTGRQIVLAGIHPKTLQPYRRRWPDGKAHRVDALPTMDAKGAATIIERLKIFIVDSGWELVSVSRPGRVAAGPPPMQAGLKAPLGWVRDVMAGLRNDVERFGPYDRWLDVGYALKAATQDDPAAGLDLWLEWCGRFEGESDEAENLRTWDKIKGPYYLGAHALADFAGVSSASLDFVAIEDAEDEPPPWATFFRLEGEDSLDSPPPELTLVDGLLGIAALAMLWGRSGSLKSFIAQSLSVAVATGTPWMGRKTTQGGVLYFAGEGGAGLGARIVAARQTAGLVKGDLRYWRRANMAPEIAKRPEVRRAVIDAARACGEEWDLPVLLIIIDTLATSYTGDENSNSDMRDYAKAAAEIRAKTGATVLVIHHSGKDEDRGARGAQALRDFADTMIHVERPDPELPRVTFTIEKQREGEDNVRISLEAVPTLADLGAAGLHETLAITGGAAVNAAAPASALDLNPDDRATILRHLAGREWRVNEQAEDSVGRAICSIMAWDPGDRHTRSRVWYLVRKLTDEGALIEYEKRAVNRHMRKFVRVKDLNPFD